MSHDNRVETEKHVKRVQDYLSMIMQGLAERGRLHDLSKLSEPEKSAFDETIPKLAGLTYGSEEYKANLAEMKPALEHHYANNRHHPEHFEDGIKGMTLVDLVEMFCDWCAATERHDDGDIGRSIEHNKNRLGYDEVLASIFANTAQEYRMGKSQLKEG